MSQRWKWPAPSRTGLGSPVHTASSGPRHEQCAGQTPAPVPVVVGVAPVPQARRPDPRAATSAYNALVDRGGHHLRMPRRNSSVPIDPGRWPAGSSEEHRQSYLHRRRTCASSRFGRPPTLRDLPTDWPRRDCSDAMIAALRARVIAPAIAARARRSKSGIVRAQTWGARMRRQEYISALVVRLARPIDQQSSYISMPLVANCRSAARL